nr:MAG TPA: hypothetical protein [Caudoviricetes sp.]
MKRTRHSLLTAFMLTGAHDAIPTCHRTSSIKNQKSFQNGRIRTCKPSLSA